MRATTYVITHSERALQTIMFKIKRTESQLMKKNTFYVAFENHVFLESIKKKKILYLRRFRCVYF